MTTTPEREALAPKLENIISGHRINDDDAAWLRALLAASPAAGGVQPEAWRDMATAPKDGTLLRLLVDFEDHSFEDSSEPCATIGANNLDNTDVDEWQFAGWSWQQDCFTQGVGKPVGWLPMLATQPAHAQAWACVHCGAPHDAGGCLASSDWPRPTPPAAPAAEDFENAAANAYDDCAALLSRRKLDQPGGLPGSVVESFQMLLEHWDKTHAPAAASDEQEAAIAFALDALDAISEMYRHNDSPPTKSANLFSAANRAFEAAVKLGGVAARAPQAAAEGQAAEMEAQLRHLIDDLVEPTAEHGWRVKDRSLILFSNFVGAVQRLLYPETLENGLTEAETDASPSVAGLTQPTAQPEAAEPVPAPVQPVAWNNSPAPWMLPHPKCDEACLYQCTEAFSRFPRCATPPVERAAARYRWLAQGARITCEHWGGRWSLVIDGPAPVRDDLDAAIDAALAGDREKQP